MKYNRASWHKSCRQLYRASALDHAKRNHAEGLSPPRKVARRTSAPANRHLCIFCDDKTSAADHSFQKLTLTKEIHDKAVRLGENRIVAILAEDDLVAIEAKYHRNCYTRFTRRYDELCKQNIAIENFAATAQTELLQYMKEGIAEDRRIFRCKI